MRPACYSGGGRWQIHSRDYPNEGYYGGAQKVEDYYGIGSQSQRERREERERIDRLARFEQPGGVHTLVTLP